MCILTVCDSVLSLSPYKICGNASVVYKLFVGSVFVDKQHFYLETLWQFSHLVAQFEGESLANTARLLLCSVPMNWEEGELSGSAGSSLPLDLFV